MLSRREAIAGVRTIAAIAISVYSGQFLFGQMCLTPAAAASAAVFGGFTSGLVAGGLQGAITGAFGASMFFGIGNYFSSPAMAGQSAGAVQAQKILAHGIAGGISHELQGGKFGHGFLASGLTEAFAPGIAQIESDYAQVFMAALTSGTVTALSGGKFANGAMTGAFSYAFAARAESKQETRSLSYETVSGPDYWPDGSYDWRIKWRLSEPSLEGGWIVQEIKYKLDAVGVDGVPLTRQAHYWEAWRVDPGQSTTTSPLDWDDTFGANVRGSAASIKITTTASARFYEGLQLPAAFRSFNVPSAGSLPATTVNPNLQLRGATEPVSRMFNHDWP
jgi:hypothetical protein